jgi:hypothetical protein
VAASSGRLLHPSKPLTAMERTLSSGWSTASAGYLGHTHTLVTGAMPSSTVVLYALAVNTTAESAAVVSLSEFWPPPSAPSGGYWVAWDTARGACGARTTTPDGAGLPLQLAIDKGCATLVRSGADAAVDLSTGVAHGAQGICDAGVGWGPSCKLTQLSPVGRHGFALLGELGAKLVPVSEYRFASASSSLSAGGDAVFDVVIRGHPSEAVAVAALVPCGATNAASAAQVEWKNVTVGVSGSAHVQFSRCAARRWAP